MKKGLIAFVALTTLVLGATMKPAEARWGWGHGWGSACSSCGGYGWGGLGLGMGLGSEYYGNPYTGYGGLYNNIYPYSYGYNNGLGIYSSPALYGNTCGSCYY